MKKFLLFTPPVASLIALLSISTQGFSTHRIWIIGLLLAFALTSYNCISAIVKSSRHGIDLDDYLDKHQSVEFSVSTPIDVAFDESKQAVTSIGAKKIDVDETSKKIDASTGWSFDSAGHRISIQLLERGDQDTEVRLQSSPRGNWGMMDSGKGRDNIEAIKKRLITNRRQSSPLRQLGP